jgi:predicted ATPase
MLEARSSEAVQLFVARARERLSDFDLTTRNWRGVVAICRQLDGLPLALELAAARIGSIDESDIAARLGLGLALQVRARRSAPRRHQTLRATIEWSHDLLSQTERILFRRLAVSADGWALDATEAMLRSTRAKAYWTIHQSLPPPASPR